MFATGVLSSQAKAEVTLLCPNAATQGTGISDSYSSFSGSQDATCAGGGYSGVTMSIPTDTDYAKLTWTGLPAGLTLGNLPGLTALVSFTGPAGDSPYFELEFQDTTGALNEGGVGGAAGDQVLLLQFQTLGIAGAGFVNMNFDPASTPITVFDNSGPQAYLLGGQHSANSPTTLDALLADYPSIADDPVEQVRLAIGLAGGNCANCAESLSVDSAYVTPEPGTIALMFTGLGGVAILGRRRMLKLAANNPTR